MKYTKEIIQEAVSKSVSVMQVMNHLGIKMTGGSHSHIKKLIIKFNIDTSHFLGRASNSGPNRKGGVKKRTAEETFALIPESRLKAYELNRALLESGVDYRCVICLNDGSWNGLKLTLQVDHIDGNWKNNQKSNLRFLCPNCHSQTSNFGNKK